jgi:hypothetical protein
LLYPDRRSVQVFVNRNGRYQSVGEFPTDAVRFAVADIGTAILSLTSTELLLQSAGGTLHLADAPLPAFTFLAGTVTPTFLSAGALRIDDARMDIGLNSDEPAYLTSLQSDRLMVAQSTGEITLSSAAGGRIAATTCHCEIGGLTPLGRPGRLALNATADRTPLWVLDAALPPHVYFVPPSLAVKEAR